jgi:SAM-dependent methyltransferase
METKQERERDFHNAAFTDNRRNAVVPAYAIIHDSRVLYESFIRAHAPGARLLEYGCGATAMGSLVADQASEIVGIDISDVAVREATAHAAEAGLNAKYFVMDAESLTFPDQSFDLICSTAVLHHLDLRKGFGEIARVLRPGGSAVFMEPLGHNPVINLYRWWTPAMRTPDEHPLLMRDLKLAREYFDRVETRFFVLSSLAAMIVRGTPVFRPVLHSLERLDQLLFKALPPIRRYAWQVVIILGRPKGRRPTAG